MRKNRMMRLASVLLVCVLLTTSVISGTFAKYITTDAAQDSARVAEWGVIVEIANDTDDTLGAFSAVYANDGDLETDSQGRAILNTVEAEVKVVAPGTAGNLVESATITGTPEVAVRVTKEANLDLVGWVAEDGSYYCPLKITVTIDGTTKEYNGMDYANRDNPLAAFIYDIEDALSNVETYDPNHDLEASCSVAWEWAFENGVGQDNTLDTQLGDAAANGNPATISFSYSVIVEQID